MIFGLILIAVGIIFLLQNMEVISGEAWKIIWPVVVILIGVGFIVSRLKRNKARRNWTDHGKTFKDKMNIPKKEVERWHRENE